MPAESARAPGAWRAAANDVKREGDRTARALSRWLHRELRLLEQLTAEPRAAARHREPLHRLRVALKEWHAALLMLHAVDAEFPAAAIHERFRPVFHAAGRVRFWQLQRGLLQRSHPLPAAFGERYRGLIRDRLRRLRREFQATVTGGGWPRWRELRPEMWRACLACRRGALAACFTALEDRICTLCQRLDRRRRSELHEVRKLLREYTDNRKLASRYLGFDPGPVRCVPEDHSAFHERLGEWHDQDAACRQLADDLARLGWEVGLVEEGRSVLRAWRRAERELWDAVVAELQSAASCAASPGPM